MILYIVKILTSLLVFTFVESSFLYTGVSSALNFKKIAFLEKLVAVVLSITLNICNLLEHAPWTKMTDIATELTSVM